MDKNRLDKKMRGANALVYLGLALVIFTIFISGMIRVEKEKRMEKIDKDYHKNKFSNRKNWNPLLIIIENVIFWTCTLLIVYIIIN